MGRYILKRLAASIIVLIGVSIIAFSLVRLGGGDPARLLAGSLATEEEIEDYRVRMGLDKSYVSQYFTWVSGILKGDLGYSWNYRANITELLGPRIVQTFRMCILGFVWAVVFSIVFGITAGIHQGSGVDFAAMFFAILGQSVSVVFLAYMMILLFAVKLNWLPSQGIGGFKFMIMPGLCTGFASASFQTRLMRSGMVDVLHEDYITATRARGISRNTTYFKYALRNALLPIVTNIGSQFAGLVVGSTVVENVFNWPGMGQLIVQAINMRDYQLVQSILLISSTILVFSNLLADILYTVVDPRISFN